MHPLTVLYTKLPSVSNDRSVYLAGKYEDFCLRKIERIVYLLIVITLNIHKTYVVKQSIRICYEYILFIFVNTANLLRMKTKINIIVELRSVDKLDTLRFLFNRTFIVGDFSMFVGSTLLLIDSKQVNISH